MRHILILLLSAALLAGCKTSEANYRAAYEKAVAGRADRDSTGNSIYGAGRRSMDMTTAIAGSDTALVKATFVRVTEGGGGLREWLGRYNVAVGQMKQRINAISLRERLADAGYPRAFVVETPEPYYYVIVASYPTEAEAVHETARLRAMRDFPVAMRRPLPFIIRH